MNVPIKDRVT